MIISFTYLTNKFIISGMRDKAKYVEVTLGWMVMKNATSMASSNAEIINTSSTMINIIDISSPNH